VKNWRRDRFQVSVFRCQEKGGKKEDGKVRRWEVGKKQDCVIRIKLLGLRGLSYEG